MASSDRLEAAQESQGLTEAGKVQFSLTRNATYHEDRASFFAWAHRFFMFLIIALGTGAFGASLTGGDERWHLFITICAGIATLAGLIDLLWNVDGNARDHTRLRSRCYDLLARLDANEPPALIRQEFLRLVGEEPPAMYAVDALAFNRAVDAMDRPKGQKYVMSAWDVFIRNVWRFRPNQFETEEEREARISSALSAKSA
jgi:hypothetical protein